MRKLLTLLSVYILPLHLLPLWLLAGLILMVLAYRPHAALAQTQPSDEQLSVVIELHKPSVIEVYTKVSNHNLVSSAAIAAATQAQLATVEQEQQQVLHALDRLAVPVLYRNQRVYNGIAIRVAAHQLAELAQLAEVKAIHPLIAKEPANARGAALIGAPQLWQGMNGGGLTGTGMTIAVIDTGIDYLHTALGGPGSGYGQNDPTVITDVVGFPNAKIVGGYDFTGNLYNANPEDATFTPLLAPDPDPMDCYPHGTGVAGTAAGYGVNHDGAPYSGPYDQSTPLTNLRIGPGVAPAAKLYALKVFGCTGSSEIVDKAIEWAVDPNGDGDLSDHVDVINLSLGSDYGSPYDTTTLASDRAAALGVIVVAAAGNAGDHYYISSSPANGNFVLSIAASQPIFPAPQGGEPLLYETMAGFSARGPRRLDAALKPDLTAPGSSVVTAGQGSGSGARIISGTSLATPFVAGGMTLLRQRYPTWSVTELKALVMNSAATQLRAGEASSSLYSPARVGAGRIDLTRALQAQGVVYNATDPGLVSLSFGAPAVYTTSIFSKAVTLVNKSPHPLSYTLDYVAITDQPGATVNLPTEIVTVSTGSALTLPVTMTVTASALQRPRDPTVMTTTAGFARDWLSEESGYLLFWPTPATFTVPLQVGQVSLPVGSKVTGRGWFTYTAASHTLRYTVQLHNLTSAVSAIQLVPDNSAGLEAGRYTLFQGNNVLFPTLTISGSLMLAPHSVIQLAEQQLALVISTVEQPAGVTSGHLRLTAPVLKLPLYAAPRAAANLHVAAQALDFGTALQNRATLTLTGVGLTTTHPMSGVASLLSVALLQSISPRLTITDPLPVLQHVGYADLRYVGVSSYVTPLQSNGEAVAKGTIYFAVATYEPWSSPNEVEINVVIDANQDGRDDYVLYNSDQVGFNSKRHSDSLIAVLKNLKTGGQSRQAYLNDIEPTILAPGLYDNQVMLLPVSAAALGLTQQQPRFTYRVETYSNDTLYYPTGQKRRIDQTIPRQYDLSRPGLRFHQGNGAIRLPAVVGPDSRIEVDFEMAGYSVAGGQGILLLHHQNRVGDNAEVVPIRYQWATGLYLPMVLR